MNILRRSTDAIKTVTSMAVALLMAACSGQPEKPAKRGAQPPAKQSAVQAEFEQAVQLMRKGDQQQAVERFRQLAEANPQYSGPYANLGLLHLQAGRLDEAEQAFHKALELSPDNARYLNHLGVVYRRQGRFEEARDAYERALQIKPDYGDAHRNLGVLYDLYLFDYDKAERHYRRAMQLNPDDREKISRWLFELDNRAHAAN